MDKDKKPEDTKEERPAAPADGESKTANTEALNKPDSDKSGEQGDSKDAKSDGSSGGNGEGGEDKPAKKPNGLMQTFKKFRLYLLIIALVAVIGGVFAFISSVNGKKTPRPPSVQSQTLSQNQLKQLAKTGTSSNGQTLTIQGNAVLDGQALFHNNLYVAGDIQSSGSLSTPQLTLSNSGNLGNAQASQLQVKDVSTFSGPVTISNGMNVNGPTSISTASIGTLTATKIIMSSNGRITAPGHVALLSLNPQTKQVGAIPHRTVSFGVLGNGGSASIGGSDTSGTIYINTGNNPQPGCFITIIFLQPWTGTPNILLGPIGLGAGATQHTAQPITNPDSGNVTGFKICTANTPLPNQAFGFSYLVNNAPN